MISILNGDALRIPLRDGSVHCVVTSPPYWGLRDYGVEGQLGLEPTPEQYVENMVAVFREVRRVLRDNGTLWLNLGDSYYNGDKGGYERSTTGKQATSKGTVKGLTITRLPQAGLKPKDLIGIPWMVAFALRADGWYLRSDIIWYKPNPMPESVTDRPTKAHEYLFLLSKSQHYYYDTDMIREPIAESTAGDHRLGLDGYEAGRPKRDFPNEHPSSGAGLLQPNLNGRNKRSVWAVPPQPYKGAHFATFPPKLIEPCVLAGTSERGCCPECEAPWERVTETVGLPRNEKRTHSTKEQRIGNTPAPAPEPVPGGNTSPIVTTIGWEPTCQCHPDEGDAYNPVPSTVLDPFAGTATVGQVCAEHRRNFVGLELKFEYIDLAKKRVSEVQPSMFLG